MLVVSFPLVPVTLDNGPIEIASGTRRLPRKEAFRAVESSEIPMKSVPLEVGDVLIRHPWALHRDSPNLTDTPGRWLPSGTCVAGMPTIAEMLARSRAQFGNP